MFNTAQVKYQFNNRGQTLLEVIVVIAVGVIIIGALVFVTISSLRNASTAKNQAQATKLAQEGLEKVRASRDRNGTIDSFSGGNGWDSANNLWTNNLSNDICIPAGSNCYLALNSSGNLIFVAFSSTTPSIGGEQIGNFTRFVILSDDSNFAQWKIVEALVYWRDFAGTHESKMKTILRKI